MARILVAEDEHDIRDLIAFTLRFAGHDVLTAKDGQEAVEIATAEKPDLVLMDVRMPRMTGYDACKLLKAQPETVDLPVVFLSAKGQEAEIMAGFQAGALDYLLKPFAPDELTRRINELVAQIKK